MTFPLVRTSIRLTVWTKKRGLDGHTEEETLRGLEGSKRSEDEK